MKYRLSNGANAISYITYFVLLGFEILLCYYGAVTGKTINVFIYLIGALVIATIGYACMALWDIRSPKVEFPKEVIIRKVRIYWLITLGVIVAVIIGLFVIMAQTGMTIEEISLNWI